MITTWNITQKSPNQNTNAEVVVDILKTFIYKRNHEESAHINPKQHNCMECDNQTTSKDCLEKYMENAHGQINKQNTNFKCVSCAQKFIAKSSLIREGIP